MLSFRISSLVFVGASLLGAVAHAQTPSGVTVEAAWVRASVQGQKATGAFMRLTASEATRLVGVASPVAGIAEVHEMKMEGDVMKMRAVPGLDLQAGKAVELKPGGYHVMLMDLKQAVTKGATVPMTLIFKNAQGVETRLEVQAPVAAQAPGGHAGGHGAHK